VPTIQVLNNPYFLTSLAGWTAVGADPSSVVWNDGAAVLTRPVGGPLASLAQNTLVVGKPYRIQALISANSGNYVFGANFGGQQFSYTTPVVKTIDLPSAGSIQLGFYLQSADRSVRVEWVTAHRLDLSMSMLTLVMRDFDGHKKATSAMLGPVTDGASYVARKGEADALEAAINTVAGNVARSTFAANDSAPNDVNAANLLYQTHFRWIVEWTDSITGDGPYQFDIPTPNVGDNSLVLPNSIEHDPAHAGWIALKAAMNGKVLNPRTSSPISITRIYLEQ